MREGEENRSEVTSDGIAFSVKGKCTELGENLDQARGESRAFLLFFGFSTANQSRMKEAGEMEKGRMFPVLFFPLVWDLANGTLLNNEH